MALRQFYGKLRAGLLSFDLPRHSTFEQPAEERQAAADFSVVIPIFDGAPLTRCLSSLEIYGSLSEVILVDDGSGKAAKAVIEQFASRNSWTVVRNRTPLGHSRASEAGAQKATRPNLCLLNADTVVTPWSWRASQEAFDADPRIAITGPSTSHASTVQMVRRAELCRHFWNDSQIFGFAEGYVRRQPCRSWIDLPDVAGFALFIRRDVWEQCGGFDPALPDYGNEVELCKRVSKQGRRIIWTRNSYIHHLGNQSYSKALFGRKEIRLRSKQAQRHIDLKHAQSPDPGGLFT